MPSKLLIFSAAAKTLNALGSIPGVSRFLDKLCILRKRAALLHHPYIQFERGFVFIHIPKAAGTSLNQALDLHATLYDDAHTKAWEIVPFLKGLSPSLLALTFVRNPYDRFLSLYSYARLETSLYHSAVDPATSPRGKHEDYDILKDKSLEQCAELLVEGRLSPTHWAPQAEWVLSRRDNLALNAGKQNIIVDFIGHVETIDQDLKRLQAEYGIVTKAAPWVNKSESKQVPEWTPRTRDLVRLYYSMDFELFGYEA